MDRVEVDGRTGEGGGQILRTGLALAILTGKALSIREIRTGRKSPGLAPQHLAGVKAAAAISGGTALGPGGRPPRPGDTEVEFRPGPARPGDYAFEIPTAGSTGLLFQTIYLPLLCSGAPSSLDLSGGTHVPWSPTFDYLDRVFSPALAALGAKVELSIETAAYYPKGGGHIRAALAPWTERRTIDWTERGEIAGVSGVSLSSGLPDHVAGRQRDRAGQRLKALGLSCGVEISRVPSPGKGTSVCLAIRFERGFAGATALGEIGKRAETVAEEACADLAAFLATPAAVDPELADQILLPLSAVRGESRYTTSRVTRHLTTNAEVIPMFAQVRIEIEGREGEPGEVRVEGGGFGG